MIAIFHGTNLVASRLALISQKQKAPNREIISLPAKKLDLSALKQALESTSLFGQEKLVVIEGLFSLPKSKKKEEILKYLKTEKYRPNLIIWEGKQIDGRTLAPFARIGQIQEFKLSPTIFKFLDSLEPKNPKPTLIWLHQTLKTDPPELIFYLLARRVKDLIIAKDLGKKGLNYLAPWQQDRLLRQAQKFTLLGLLRLHRQLLTIDYQTKTGQTDLPLASNLDLLLLSL